MTRIERSMAALRWALVVGSGVVAATSIARYAFPDEVSQGSVADARYQCPMHPQIRSHDPGTCPICHMQLEPIPEPTAHAHDAAVALPEGHAEVHVTVERQQQFGIATVEVASRELAGERRYPAVVEARPASIAEVHTRVPAFVERIVVDRIGARVRRGQTLATAFSPEVARLGDELALAGAVAPEFRAGLESGTRAGLVRAGVDPDHAADQPADRRGRFAITAPRSGFLTRVAIPVGAFATPEVVLFEIADLDPILAIASVGDADGIALAVGDAARFQPASGDAIEVRLDSIEPSLDPATRTRRLRFSVPNRDSAILPGQIGTLLLPTARANGLAVPVDSVLDDGTTTIVFVDHGEGRFEPRTVVVGPRAEGYAAIERGLAAGERVVVRGGFLLDSESRLSAATAMPATPAGAPDAGAHAGHGGPR